MDAAGWLSDGRRGQNQEPYWKLLPWRRSAQGRKCGYRTLHFDHPVLRVAAHYFLMCEAMANGITCLHKSKTNSCRLYVNWFCFVTSTSSSYYHNSIAVGTNPGCSLVTS